ncbi:hypothetical protein [Erwinia amylovora]|uniref:hypothetical protein n=1 Tax=Erwinia amylovora TaxID=552 RepID=UPI001443FAAF|nr:hypothetical protein [Erwinia amylovora]
MVTPLYCTEFITLAVKRKAEQVGELKTAWQLQGRIGSAPEEQAILAVINQDAKTMAFAS